MIGNEDNAAHWVGTITLSIIGYSVVSWLLGFNEDCYAIAPIVRPLATGLYLCFLAVSFLIREILVAIAVFIVTFIIYSVIYVLTPKKWRDNAAGIAGLILVCLMLGDFAGYCLTYSTATEFCQAAHHGGVYRTLVKRNELLAQKGFYGFGEWSTSGWGDQTIGMIYIYTGRSRKPDKPAFYDNTGIDLKHESEY